ncbi:toprim domain-containing protein [Mycoplasmopsis columbinasalis]|uniref:Recombinational DNA repair protein n=1 Tax=Mycoplasmopsis columbinasalis TaxID=114880 RepID=A0A449BB56_9BACT|nr:toprim domain-containing protein [Mycoplasmopsis columbinasalis]VEU78412.1 recombinational DNA repair protein [Mycoplasmopsis columbinasalis]
MTAELSILTKLQTKLTALPGITKKQAEKIITHLLKTAKSEIEELVTSLKEVKASVDFCPKCNFLRHNESCLNCDQVHNPKIIVTESIAAVQKLKQMDFFDGYFYVLPTLFTNKTKPIKESEKETQHLINFLLFKEIQDVIIVLSPTIDGEITTYRLMELLSEANFKVSRAAIGMPVNSNLDYLDTFTIKQAIENRTK